MIVPFISIRYVIVSKRCMQYVDLTSSPDNMMYNVQHLDAYRHFGFWTQDIHHSPVIIKHVELHTSKWENDCYSIRLCIVCDVFSPYSKCSRHVLITNFSRWTIFHADGMTFVKHQEYLATTKISSGYFKSSHRNSLDTKKFLGNRKCCKDSNSSIRL